MKKKKLLFIIPGILLILGIAFLVYRGSNYNADSIACASVTSPAFGISTEEIKSKGFIFNREALAFIPDEETTTGIIFYPGAMVEYTAYAPLLEACAQKGIMCILVKMPLNLAIFGETFADYFKEMYPNITEWYIAGHSLGGAIAAYHMENNYEGYEGIIFLAAYSAKDLTATGLKVLSIYGSEDKVLNKEKYASCLSNLKEYTEYVIKGGNHAGFGCYGEQRGDGKATISNREQISITAEYISDFIK